MLPFVGGMCVEQSSHFLPVIMVLGKIELISRKREVAHEFNLFET